MLCESCGKKEASVKLTQIVNDKVKKINLCEECAIKSGIIEGLDIEDKLSSLSDVLLGIGVADNEGDGNADKKQCPGCKMTRKEFKQHSRLGCPLCYEFFTKELESLLDSMQKGKRHVGKTPARQSSTAGSEFAAKALRDALDAAVQAEQYEEAARIRDKINQITTSNSNIA